MLHVSPQEEGVLVLINSSLWLIDNIKQLVWACQPSITLGTHRDTSAIREQSQEHPLDFKSPPPTPRSPKGSIKYSLAQKQNVRLNQLASEVKSDRKLLCAVSLSWQPALPGVFISSCHTNMPYRGRGLCLNILMFFCPLFYSRVLEKESDPRYEHSPKPKSAFDLLCMHLLIGSYTEHTRRKHKKNNCLVSIWGQKF